MTQTRNKLLGKRDSTELYTCNDDRRSLRQEKRHSSNASWNAASVIENNSEANNLNDRYRSAILPETEQNHVSPHNHPAGNQKSEGSAFLHKKNGPGTVGFISLVDSTDARKESNTPKNRINESSIEEDGTHPSSAVGRREPNEWVSSAPECTKEAVDHHRADNIDSNDIVNDTSTNMAEIYEDDYAMLRPMVVYDYPTNPEPEIVSSIEQTNTSLQEDMTELYHNPKHGLQ